MTNNQPKLRAIPSTAYVWKDGGAATAVIVERLSSNGACARLIDLNTGQAYENIPVRNLFPMNFLPHKLSLYAGVNEAEIKKLAQFMLANFGDQLKTNQHPVQEAIRFLKNVPGIVFGAMFDFLGRLSTAKETFVIGSSEEPYRVVEELKEWAQERGLKTDDYEAQVLDWHKQVAIGQAVTDITGNANELVEILSCMQELASSDDIKLKGADKLRSLCVRIGRVIGMEV